MQTQLFFHLHDFLFAMAMASARIMPAFILLPFLNNSVVTSSIRIPVAMFVGLALWPNEIQQIPDLSGLIYYGLILKELLIGAIIAFFLCLPFWIMHAVGSIIDNQRGATLSSSIDPISGVDTSELANFFNLFAAVVVLESGGLTVMMEVFNRSYLLWAPLSYGYPSIQPMLTFVIFMVSKAILLASPLIVAFLLTELLLGLLARFAPQLNAFSLALTVKSGVAFLLILLYFMPVFPDRILSFQFFSESLMNLR